MFAWKNLKKLAGAVALFSACGLLAGCDDDHHHPPPHHPPRPPHEDHHGGPHRDDHHDRHDHRPPPRDGGRHHGHRRFASLTGSYSAFALNDAVMPKGTEISLNVVQGEDESLRLVDPMGKQYPIQLDAETGVGSIAGGSLSLRKDGNFVYRDARGGVWLVVRQ
ncbi:MAG: hypothetical protein J6Z82_02930 [Schwartzia sp.]|nr:hypothetical protein [Schwartzia sp. (in: firmicutes)]